MELKCVVRREGSKETAYKSSKDEGILFSYSLKSKDEISKTYAVSVANESKVDFSGVVHIKLCIDAVNPKIFMPGYMYNTNTAGMDMENRKAFPRLMKNSDCKYETTFWMTRADRLAVPVSLTYDSGRIYGISAKPANNEGNQKYNGFTCDIDDDGLVSVGFTLGYENAPFLFVQTATVYERADVTKDNAYEIKAGEKNEFELIVYEYTGSSEQAVNEAIKHAYFLNWQSPRTIDGMTEKKAVELLSAALRDYAWLEDEKMYTGFVYDKPNGNRLNKIGSLSWTNGLSVATPMLMAANKLEDELARKQALSFIENVVTNAMNHSSNLLYDAVTDGVWSAHGWWYDGMRHGGHSAYINGQAVYYILKAYLSEKECRGLAHAEWVEFIKPVIKQMNSQVDDSFEYPFAMSEEDGRGIEYDSMGGAWCLAATAMYVLVTGSKEYDEILAKSEEHYYEKYVKVMECYGGPLDTDKAVDDEGILAFMRAARILHELTGDRKYLEHLRDAIYFECSFKLGFNTPVEVRPLSEVKWSSCGGSITSTANPHIHPMSSTVIDEMKYCTEHINDPYIEQRLDDTIKWSMQTFNTYDKEYGYGKIGWMSERFCFCQGLLVEKYPDGETASTWFALMSWAAASIIEGLVSLI